MSSIKTLTFHTLEYQLNAHHNDFIQVNRFLNDKLVEKVTHWAKIDQPKTVIDLFCGLGNFTIPLSFHSQKTIGIEISESMVEKAKENARINQSKAVFEQADLTQINAITWPYGETDWLVIDPPRSGAKEIAQIIETINPKTIIYVSCNPATLMRDLSILYSYNYALDNVFLYDMFAQTTHIETLVKLSR